ncbi:MAG: right-handed parallel beta-helix repeat-containing protein [Candidatus Tectomicrobia bacterium]|nr:right-handed parallel beta-helix repeat-containing protein [Candidatus Tectomicrobia bacterium]
MEKIIYVNIQDPQASDQNPGTDELPLKTISKAAEIAIENKKQNIGTKIIIYPGTYRESIKLEFSSRETDAPAIFEAKEKGSAIISGSDIWDGWKRQGNTDIYTNSWPYKWGLAPYPGGWERQVVLEPIVRRREMIFANGKLLEQVLSYQELKEGSFYVSEEEETAYVWIPSGTTIENTTIEVATRSSLFYMNGKRSVILRGLTFQHDNTPLQGSAVRVNGSSNILVEDCAFIWNNWGGFGFWVSQNVAARRNVANHNGAVGMTAWRVKNLLFEDNETSYNNWRGVRGGFTGWAAAGLKHLRVHDGIYRRHISAGNQARGFWLDSDNATILIEKAFLCKNLINGIFIEANQGPITIKDSIICHNQKDAGILTANSSNVVLENNILYGNGRSQIRVTGNIERSETNWETGEKMTLRVERWLLKNNAIVGKNRTQFPLETPDWKHFLGSLASGGNLWYNPENKRAFKIGGKGLDLSGWQSTTRQDLDSIFADPRFIDPDNNQFDLLPDSPLLGR